MRRTAAATVLLALTISSTSACSTSVKREDGAAMPPPQQGSHGSQGTGTGASAPVATPRVYLQAMGGEIPVNVEVVSTDAKIEKGLMYRQHLPVDGGMLFLMGREREWSFWMRNTLIPLDMIFIAKDMTIAGIVENAEPQTETLRTVGKPSYYVLEVNGGWTRKNGVMAGAKVRFENVE